MDAIFGVPLMQLDTSSSVSLSWQDGEYKAGFKSLPSVKAHCLAIGQTVIQSCTYLTQTVH